MASPRFFLKARSKTKNRSKNRWDWISVALVFVGALLFYCVLFPDGAGVWGRHCAKFLGWLAGVGRFALPILFAYFGVRHLLHREGHVRPLKILILLGLFWSAEVLFTLLGETVWKQNFGGILGRIGEQFLTRLFGSVGAWIVTLGAATVLTFLLARISPREMIHHLLDVLRRDWDEWMQARRVRTRERKPPVVPSQPALDGPIEKPLKIVGLPESAKTKSAEKPPVQEIVKDAAPLISERKPANGTAAVDRGPASAKEKKATKTAEASVVSKPYESPPLSIFETIEKSKPVAREELTSRAKLLEQTLANFGIAAAVVEIHPGPVITRYDLEPAPGVKVASITSRADDLALAMRSVGIRVLAPIPGKGAVGIEIPNSTPEIVGLRELLEKPEFLNHPSPLAFVLGKTVSGEPYVVDLATLPHILVAGATGSGKSVVVHAMISSILFRVAPDTVKFVLIDPKRLELPSYSAIPHLYDPRVAPIQSEVITNSKQAAKALMRLVKVMEYRYDLFAKANVRNIDSYNQKRKSAGLPPEYFIVVVIDELADLMITSPKEVEDAIQRLAQMARAVGIHLVLATQRPSVDVITGVIKANLPARIALRVASATDSRVIVDTAGADCLLGKGDMLFLPPASPEPIRVQGAFVSERDVESLVTYVRQFGMPSYEDLFSSGSALEFAVEDKKEMKDLIEALKLVLERRRVSQDLLKAHFGSSARATNILSLLEVKQFISKPEGTNRWEINFDLIEEFISKVGNMPAEELTL